MLYTDDIREVPAMPAKKRLLLLTSLLLAGCAAAQPPGPADTGAGTRTIPATRTLLESHRWQLQKATDARGRRIDALLAHPHGPLTLVFAKGKVSVHNTCNAMGGDYTLAGGTLQLHGLLHTMMACADPALSALDHAIGKRLRAAPTLRVQPGTPPHLRLVTPDGDTLVFVRAPTAPGG